MLESVGGVDAAMVKPDALRRTAFAGIVVAVAGVAVPTVAQVVIGWQESLTTEALRTLGYGAQLAGLALVLLVVVLAAATLRAVAASAAPVAADR